MLLLQPNFLTGVPEPVLKVITLFGICSFVFCGIKTILKTESWGWCAIFLCLYFYTIHIYFVAELYWRFDLHPYWFEYPYFVAKNHSFSASFAIHAFFCATYSSLIYLYILKKKPSVRARGPLPQPNSLLFLSIILALGVFLFIWREPIGIAWEQCRSLYYTYKRGHPSVGHFYIFTRLLFEFIGMGIFYILGTTLLFGKPKRLLAATGITLLFYFLLAAFLGDKLSLTIGFLFVSTLYFRKKRQLLVAIMLAIVFAGCFNWISLVRSKATLVYCGSPTEVETPDDLSKYTNRKFGMKLNWFTRTFLGLIDNGEFLSNYSTYAILNKEVPSFSGGSLHYFLKSLFPSFLGVQRPQEPYDYFAEKTGMKGRTGWGISYISDWLMNFGFIGVLTGALLLVFFHISIYQWSQTSLEGQFAFGALVGGFPIFLRSALDFKSFIYTALLSWIILRLLLYRTSSPAR